jgi:hypothetical protein
MFVPSRLLLVLLLAVIVAGCADSVDPTYDADKPYTLYGVLDPTADSQALRVVPFAPDLNPREPAPVGAEVTSTDLQTGETVTWRDSLVTFGEGRFGTVYLADFRPTYRHTYRIEARREDGAVSSAEVTVPPFVEPLAQPMETPIGAVVLSAIWPAAPRLNEAQAVFVLADADCNTLTEAVPVSRPAEPFEFGWEVPTDFLEDARLVLDNLAPNNNVALLDLRLRAVVSSDDWVPAGGVYDPEVLVDPNALTNVEDGFGFVGAGYVVDVSVTPGFDVVQRGGFRPRGSCVGGEG